MTSMMQAYNAWSSGEFDGAASDFRAYTRSIAQARYVMRKIDKIVDEQATEQGLEPLQHKALLQIHGTDEPLPVSRIAERLDVAPALASRLIKGLADKGLARREHTQPDRRVTTVTATPEGVETLREIDRRVHIHVHYFQERLSEEDQFAAMTIFAFYVGLDSDSGIAKSLREGLRRTR